MPGLYFEDFTPGRMVRHSRTRTITEADNVLFCTLTMNTQPLHLDAEFAARTPFGQRLVNGLLTLGLAIGISVADLTEGTIVANLGYERILHPRPMFHGDTLRIETDVLEARPSASRPECGVVRLRHRGFNQRDEVVLEVERSLLVLRRPAP